MKIRTHGVRDRWRDVFQLVILFVVVFWMCFTMRYQIMGWTLMFGLTFVAWAILRARIDRRRRIAVRSGVTGPAADPGGEPGGRVVVRVRLHKPASGHWRAFHVGFSDKRDIEKG